MESDLVFCPEGDSAAEQSRDRQNVTGWNYYKESFMTDDAKKYMTIAFAVVSLSIAGIVTFRSFSGGGGSAKSGTGVALMCKTCGGFEVSVDEFRAVIAENPMALMPMPGVGPALMNCPQCGEKSCIQAQKCEKCENIFYSGQAGDRKYPDRCPKCKFSAVENRK